MTCEELHLYFEEHWSVDMLGSEAGVIAEHIAACAACGRFAEDRRKFANGLRIVRDLAGATPESLDTAVLRNYRQHIAGRQSQSLPIQHRWLRPRLGWAWATIAAVFLVGVVWLFSTRKPVTVSTPPTRVQPAETPSVAESTVPTPAKPAVAATKRPPVKASRRVPSPIENTSALLPVRAARSLPDGFRSLMYCDALSCGEGMDMIRVQLPSAVMPRQASGFIQTSGSVTADVIVGPDGIARGIRFEEIEF